MEKMTWFTSMSYAVLVEMIQPHQRLTNEESVELKMNTVSADTICV